jgi:hypothetical protein
MSNKKKRNKKYQGSVPTRPTITKVSAVKHHPAKQWWMDHKRMAKPIGIAAAIAIGVIIILIGIIGLFI